MKKEMGGSDGETETKKLRLLCLHGFRTSAEILKHQINRWPKPVLEKLDLDFIDAPNPARGKSLVDGIFDPPFYEWFEFNKDFSNCFGLFESIAYIEDYLIKHGPFDGIFGFSQGAIIAGVVPGLQATGTVLTKVPKIKCVFIIAGAKLTQEALAENPCLSPIDCPSVHFLGDMDHLREKGIQLMESFIDPCLIPHSQGHIIPKLEEPQISSLLNFIEKTLTKKDE